MPTELLRANARPAAPRSNARNVNIVLIALTAALVTLQLAGLAMLERSHARPVSSAPAKTAICIERADIPVAPTPYD